MVRIVVLNIVEQTNLKPIGVTRLFNLLLKSTIGILQMYLNTFNCDRIMWKLEKNCFYETVVA